MKRLVVAAVVLAATLGNPVSANTYVDSVTLDCGIAKAKHAWRRPDDYNTTFLYWLKPCGITLRKDNVSFRYSYAEGEKVYPSETEDGRYSGVSIDFRRVESFELMYTLDYNRWEFSLGAGWYEMPMPHFYDNGGGRWDADDDKGYFGSIHYRLSDNFGIMYKYTHHSQIGTEYTESHGIHLTYRF